MAQIFISLGSNIDKAHYVRQGILALKNIIPNLSVSDVYESESVGFNGNNFYNLVCGGQTALTVDEVCQALRDIEVDNGRVRSAKKFSSRTLDLDLLTFDDLIVEQPAQLPRHEIDKNAFVLWPLAQVAPQFTHPVLKQTYQTLWDNYNKSEQSLWAVEFDWQGII